MNLKSDQCPLLYLEVAIYKGSGDKKDAANFKCCKPTWQITGIWVLDVENTGRLCRA